MQLLWETNKVSERDAKLHQSEQERAKLKKEATKLKLRLQETTEKLDAGKEMEEGGRRKKFGSVKSGYIYMQLNVETAEPLGAVGRRYS